MDGKSRAELQNDRRNLLGVMDIFIFLIVVMVSHVEMSKLIKLYTSNMYIPLFLITFQKGKRKCHSLSFNI